MLDNDFSSNCTGISQLKIMHMGRGYILMLVHSYISIKAEYFNYKGKLAYISIHCHVVKDLRFKFSSTILV